MFPVVLFTAQMSPFFSKEILWVIDCHRPVQSSQCTVSLTDPPSLDPSREGGLSGTI